MIAFSLFSKLDILHRCSKQPCITVIFGGRGLCWVFSMSPGLSLVTCRLFWLWPAACGNFRSLTRDWTWRVPNQPGFIFHINICHACRRSFRRDDCLFPSLWLSRHPDKRVQWGTCLCDGLQALSSPRLQDWVHWARGLDLERQIICKHFVLGLMFSYICLEILFFFSF